MQMPAPDTRVFDRKDQIVAQLRAVLPAAAVITELSETRAYECDGLTAYRCPPMCAVLPSTTAEVAAVMKIVTIWTCPWCRVALARRSLGGRCPQQIASSWAWPK